MCIFVLIGSARVTKLSLPLYLGDEGGEGMEGEEGHQPYRELSITITLQLPCITIHPPQILLTPVPLESNATATLTLNALGYARLVYKHTHRHSVLLFTPGQKTVPATVLIIWIMTHRQLLCDHSCSRQLFGKAEQ